MSKLALQHTKHLSKKIGPRGSCTAGERKAHEYCRKVLGDLKLDVQWEEFRAPLSAWSPFALATGLVVLAVLLSLIPNIGALVAAVLTLIVVVSFFLHVTNRDNPLRWFLPVGPSQNVWAKIDSKDEPKRAVVVSGHVDTHRTAWLMSGKGPFSFLQLLTTVGPIAIIALFAIFVIQIFAPSDGLRTVSLALAALVLVMFVLMLWPDFTKHVPGANDNATGAAAVLDFAARLKKKPLNNTDVYVLLTGCEEVGAYGSEAFVRAHPELQDADYLVLDSIGGKGTQPHYLLDETLLFPMKAAAGLIKLAQDVGSNGDFGAVAKNFKGAYTDLTPIAQAGRRGISFLNYRLSDGMIPDWHQQSDTFERVDADVLDHTQNYVWAILQALDEQA